jgi:hypothetical protein
MIHAVREAQAEEAAEKVGYFVIPSEARNLSWIGTQQKRDSSARSAPRNDKIVQFSACCSPGATRRRQTIEHLFRAC